MRKTTIILLLFLLLIFAFSGCTDNNEISSTNNLETENVTGEQMDEPKTEESEITRLSDSCQKIVSTGMDEDGSVWEIVAEVKESAKGSQLLVGVIKDNEWFLEMGTDCPFVHQGVYWEEDGSNFDEIACSYVGKQTFACYGIFWNVNSGKWVQYGDEWDWGNSTQDDDKDGELIFLHRGRIQYSNGEKEWIDTSVIILDIETFESKEVYISGIRGTDSFRMSSATDGSFYVYYNESGDINGWPSKRYNVTFYSKNGEELFDLDEYNTDTSSISWISPFDDNNLCTISVSLNSGSRFEVVIDTQGNIISETKIQ